MTIHIISFAVGLPHNEEVIERFRRQANACSFIDKCVIVTDDGSSLYESFIEKFGIFSSLNPRGFGYWIWKPYIVSSYLKKLGPEDVLIYCDIGCELSMAGSDRFLRYIKHLDKNHITAFGTMNRQPEYVWSKKELIDLFGLPQKLLQKEQVAATFFILKASDFSQSFANRWLEIASSNKFRYINDFCDADQLPGFIEHRHDQSIFSMLIKQSGVEVIRERTNFPPEMYYKNSYVYSYPFHTLRSTSDKHFIKWTDMVNYRFSSIQLIKYYLKFVIYGIRNKLRKRWLK